jgi:hypothetical protein
MAVPALPDSAFVTTEVTRLLESLCHEDERTVGRDNTISWAGMCLQLPESPLRRHYVKAKVKVHAYPDSTLAVLHGPRVIGRYSGDGILLTERVAERSPVPEPANPVPTVKSAVLAASSVAARSSPARRARPDGRARPRG